MFNLFRVTAADEFIPNNGDLNVLDFCVDDKALKTVKVSSELITLVRRVRADVSTIKYLLRDIYRTIIIYFSFGILDLLRP